MQFTRYKTILLRILGENMAELLKKTNAIIAGGSITSLFSQSQINDFDVYFRSKEDMIIFIRNAYHKSGNPDNPEDLYPLTSETTVKFNGNFNITCQCQTSRSLTFTENSNTIQLIHFAYFNTPSEIFESYDFHCNMAAYDFSTEDFVLHEKFLEDVAARRLTFNENTRYPIMSTLRVSKYLDRGYTINRKEMFKLGLTCSNLNLDTWEKMIDQLSGFYGVDVKEMFDTTKPFSMELALEMLDLVYDVPETDLIIPTFDQIMFMIAGNPYGSRNMVYRMLNVERTEGVITHYIDPLTGTKFPLNCSEVIIDKPMTIDYTPIQVNSWSVASTRIYALLKCVDVEVTRGVTQYLLSGKVQMVGKY